MEINNIIVDTTYKQWGFDIERRFRQQQNQGCCSSQFLRLNSIGALGDATSKWMPNDAMVRG